MKIVVIGTGYVGLPHAAVLSEYGHEVHAYDIDETRIAAYQSGDADKIERYVNEPGLADIVAENVNRYLHFTTDISAVVEDTDVFFLCINTPPNRDGSTDISYYLAAIHHLGELLARRNVKRRVVLVNKSTVPIGTARMLESVMLDHGVENFGVASNPEFLAQGSAVEGSRRPDRIVIGADTAEDMQILRRVYSQFVNHVRIRYRRRRPRLSNTSAIPCC